MNIKQLEKQVGHDLRLRPYPIRIGPGGGRLPNSDDPWRLEAILDNPTRVRLANLPTGHFVELEPDNIREYQSPDFLVLKCQLRIEGRNITREPLLQVGAGYTVTSAPEAGIIAKLAKKMDDWHGSHDIVVIENFGPGEAHDVTLEFLGKNCPVPDSELKAKLPVPVLHPHTDIKLMAALSFGCAPPFDVIARWIEADGSQRQKQFRLT